MSTIKTNSDLNDDQLGPILSGIKKMPQVNAPEGYFTGFQDKLLQRIKEEELPMRRLRSISIYPKLAWAASIVLFIGFSLSIYLMQQKTNHESNVDALITNTDDYYLQEVDLEHVMEVAFESPYVDSLNSTALEEFIDADDILLDL